MEIIEKRNKKEGFNPKQMRKVRKIEFNYLIPKKMLINRSSLKFRNTYKWFVNKFYSFRICLAKTQVFD